MKILEQEIRPQEVFNEYLALTEKDVQTYFSGVKLQEYLCPVCEKPGEEWVNKSGFNYQKCPTCYSIFVNPRPVRDAFDAYYTDSPSTKFWATTFYKVTEAARREKLWKPKAQLIKDTIQKMEGSDPVHYIVDIGGGYGVFDEEIKKILDCKAIIIEPSVHLAKICRDKGFEVIEAFMEDLKPDQLPLGRKCFVSFELFEHLHDPLTFLQTVLNTMNSADIFIFTTLSGMGLDIQVLKENAKALSPPHHLNFLNPQSVSVLLERSGFEVLEALTPGSLDFDILKNNRQFIKDEFWKNVLGYLPEDKLTGLQEFISKSGLSSHMMITCRKP